MKRLCAILLGLMMLAGLCACGRRTSPAPAPKTPEPVTVITPAQPAPSEAVPVSTPDGTTPLTAAELDWFGRCFFNAYYRVGGEAEAAYCRILSGWHTADGLTVLQYDGGTVTLRQLDGRWVFVSNVPGRSA